MSQFGGEAIALRSEDATLSNAPPFSPSFPVRGDKLASLRLAHHWTEAEAARRAGVSEQLIRRAESGGPLAPKELPPLAWLYRTKELQLKPEDLLADSAEFRMASEPSASLAARVQRWFDGQWNHFNLDVIDELAVPDFTFYTEAGVVRGAQAMKERVISFRECFGDFDIVADKIADFGDALAIQWRAALTHTGPWLGIPATGRRIKFRGASWVVLAGDMFGDAWDFWDPGVIFAALTKP
jgi:transcriptional regulator with XRE-family HTH domain